MAGARARSNPYVGPRAYQTGEQLYGRARELAGLRGLLVAERLVLLYAPSGAGKSSLIQAALIPELARRHFRVRPVIRVGIMPAEGLPAGANRYLLSTLLSLEQDQPPARQAPLAELATLNLATYLDRRAAAEGAAEEVLIFDQFEEVLTLDPTDQAAKAAFFAGLGDALRDRQRWALFALREDYLAGLDPYRGTLPGGLATGFRLDLLGPAAAQEAIQEPARAAGVDFADAAAIRLVDDLRRVVVQRSDGTTQEELGPYVEPVQLQVVCRGLWDRLAAGAVTISEQELAGGGNVDAALGAYYAAEVAAVARATGVPELRIRDWCEEQLIAPSGIRSQVLRTGASSSGLADLAIAGLVDAHLVRAEERRGATWYELAHDRLIGPLRADNARWRQTHLQAWQQQARLWARQGQPGGLLLVERNPRLAARRWSATHPDEVSSVERAFLIAGDAEARKRRGALFTVGTLLALLVFALLAYAALAASGAATVANQARATAEAERQLSVQARATAEGNQQRALSAATAAVRAQVTANASRQFALEQAATAEAAQATAVTAYGTAQVALADISRQAAQLGNQVSTQSNKIATHEAIFAAETGTPLPIDSPVAGGRYPAAQFVVLPPADYERGRRGQKPVAIVNRLLQGTIPQALQFWSAPQGQGMTSAHYLVGTNGRVVQTVNDFDTAFHAGTLREPQVDLAPWLTTAAAAGFNANTVTFAVDWEGSQPFNINGAQAGAGAPWWQPAPAQYTAGLALLRYLVHTYAISGDRQHINLASDLDSVLRWWSPGQGFPIDQLLADLQKP